MTQSHRHRYEGWRNDDNGETVERFDKQDYRWVVLDLADVPDGVISQRRSG